MTCCGLLLDCGALGPFGERFAAFSVDFVSVAMGFVVLGLLIVYLLFGGVGLIFAWCVSVPLCLV